MTSTPSAKTIGLAAAFAAMAEDVVKKERESIRVEVQEFLDENGIKSLSPTLPDGTEVGTVTRTGGKLVASVTDEKALTEWVSQHAPSEVVETTVVVREIRAPYRKRLLDQMAKRKAPEAITEDGEIVTVPGVEMTTTTTSHRVTGVTDPEVQAALGAAWARGEIDLGDRFKALIAGGQQ